jgi:hypothetical protein
VQYGPGDVRLGQVDLDVVPPDVTASGADVDLQFLNTGGPDALLVTGGTVRVAMWEGLELPDRDDCEDRISRFAQDRVEVPMSAVLCVRTSEDAFASFTVVRIDKDEPALFASVIVWA